MCFVHVLFSEDGFRINLKNTFYIGCAENTRGIAFKETAFIMEICDKCEYLCVRFNKKTSKVNAVKEIVDKWRPSIKAFKCNILGYN